MKFPASIICLTEESVETLYDLGKGELITGVSAYVKRPKEASLKHPKISLFTSSQIETIVSMSPDLVLGFSDLQKDIARDLIAQGLNVFIANHRSLEEILSYVQLIAGIVGEQTRGEAYRLSLQEKMRSIKKKSLALRVRPKVYFEEWDDPMISAIQWVSEAISLSGGDNLFVDRGKGKLAHERFVQASEVIEKNPDIIFGCWCGKKVKLDSFAKRKNWGDIDAIKHDQLFELEPEIFLQPGPAIIKEGLDILFDYFQQFNRLDVGPN